MARGRGKLRTVVMVARGGADLVLFDCGHASVMNSHPGRSPYPLRRYCGRCPHTAEQPIDRAKFLRDHRGVGYIIERVDGQWAAAHPEEAAR